MPRRPRELDLDILDDEEELDKQHSAAILDTISGGSAGKYESLVTRMVAQGFTPDYFGMRRLILAVREPYAIATVKGMISAVRKLGRAKPKVETAEDGRADDGGKLQFAKAAGENVISAYQATVLIELAQGRLNKRAQCTAQPPRTLRGAINYAKLLQLCEVAKADGAPQEEIFAIKVCFATSSREEAFGRLTPSCFQREHGDSGPWMLVALKDHDPRAMTEGRKVERRRIHDFIQQPLDHLLTTMRPFPSAAIFRGLWKPAKVLSWIAKAAEKHRWGSKLEWTIHSLRHGSAQTIAQTLGQQRVADYTGHDSEDTAEWYAMADQERLDLLDRELQKAQNAAAAGQRVGAAVQALEQRKQQKQRQQQQPQRPATVAAAAASLTLPARATAASRPQPAEGPEERKKRMMDALVHAIQQRSKK